MTLFKKITIPEIIAESFAIIGIILGEMGIFLLLAKIMGVF